MKEDLVPRLASILHSILDCQSKTTRHPRTQTYIFSGAELHALQDHFITSALEESTSSDDIAVCIGALAQGASLLQTTFQPLVLTELLDFIVKAQTRKVELQAYLDRLGLSSSGTVAQLKERIKAELVRLKAASGRSDPDDRKTELGQLPRVVIVKKEVERILALPIPGFWALPELVSTLLPGTDGARNDEDIFEFYRNGSTDLLHASLVARNDCVFRVIKDVRRRVSVSQVLVNEARVLSVNFLDICRQHQLRKLMFMQQVCQTQYCCPYTDDEPLG